jgi:hypothetical protein
MPQPETLIRNKLRKLLEQRGWHVEVFYGSRFQKGIPDLWLWHVEHGWRWVDVKQPKSYRLTKDQSKKWPLWESKGIGVWILTAATEAEYAKLFAPPNWREYDRSRYRSQMRELTDLWTTLRQ